MKHIMSSSFLLTATVLSSSLPMQAAHALDNPILWSSQGTTVIAANPGNDNRATEIWWDSNDNLGCKLTRNAGAWDGDPNQLSTQNIPNHHGVISNYWEVIDDNSASGPKERYQMLGWGAQTVRYKVFCDNGAESEILEVTVTTTPMLWSSNGSPVVAGNPNTGDIATEIMWDNANNMGCVLARNVGAWDDDPNTFSMQNIPEYDVMIRSHWAVLDDNSANGLKARNQMLGWGPQTVWYKVFCDNNVESEELEVVVTTTPVLWSSQGSPVYAANPDNDDRATEIMWHDSNHQQCKLLRNAGAWDGDPNAFSTQNIPNHNAIVQGYWEIIEEDQVSGLEERYQKLGWGAQTVWYKVACANNVESSALEVVVLATNPNVKPVLWSSQGNIVVAADPANDGRATEIMWDNKNYPGCKLARNAGAWDGDPHEFSFSPDYWEVIDETATNGLKERYQKLGWGSQTVWYKVFCDNNVESDTLVVFVNADPVEVIEYEGPVAQTITTGSGNDRVVTGGGHDVINAGDGNNYVDAYNGMDTVTTGSGDDTIYAGSWHDTVDAGDGNNLVYAGSGNDIITTGTGDDEIYGDIGKDIITAGKGNDKLYGGRSSDTYIFNAGDGHDTIFDGYIDSDGIVKWGGSDDKIVFNGLIMDQVVFRQEGEDLIIDAGSDSIRVISHFASRYYSIEIVELDDITLTHLDIKNMVQ